MDEMKINVMYFVFTYALLAISFFPVIFDMIAFLIVCMYVCVRMYARMFIFVYIPTGLVKLGVNGNIVGNVKIFSKCDETFDTKEFPSERLTPYSGKMLLNN